GNGKQANQPPREWVAEVFEQLECQLVAYVSRRVSNPETARDVVQEAFVKLCQQSWPAIEEHTKAWLYKTCRNRAIDISRREGRMNMVQADTDVSNVQDQHSKSAEEGAAQDEQLHQVRTQIEKLPERQQELLRLRLHDGLSYKQIAEVTGLTVTNVGYLLHQAVAGLRGKLQVE
ncbi:MAG: RNA polymerase sigma factor, partial [Planctomycetota bacterium]